MQLPIIAHRGPAKPYGSIPRINWDHPLARGLVSYGYDAGSGPIDLVTGGQRTITNTGAPFGGRKQSKYGPALTSVFTSGSVTNGLFNLPTSDPIVNLTAAAPYSFASGFMLTADPGTNNFSQIYCSCDATTNTSFGIGAGGAASLDLLFNFGAAAAQTTATALLILNKFNTAVGVAIDGANARCYVNGVLALSPVITTTAAGRAGSKPCFWGRPNVASQTVESGYIYFGAMWSGRALTASEARLLQDDPYCLLIYPEDEMFASLVGALAVPFQNQEVNRAPLRLALPQPSPPLNPSLFTNPFPFNQTDWSPPARGPHISPDSSLALNPNLFTNPVPNNQTDWSQSRRLPDFQPDASVSLNINLLTNPVPFNQTDWAKPVRAPLALPQPPPPLNPNLFKNPVPFNQVDWSDPVRVRAVLLPTDPLNINLLSNNIPFNQTDWSKPQRIWVTQPQPQSGLNINLFTNPVPVANFALAAPFAVCALPTPSQAYNPNLYGVVAVSVPLNQFDVAKPFFPRAVLLPTDPLNINLFTNAVPFNQADWSASRRLVGETQVPDGLNLNLFTNPVPFAAADTGSRRLASLVPPDQPYNAALYTVTVVAAQPFTQGDVPLVRRPLAATVLPDPLNPNLFRNDVPIANIDSSTPMRLRAALDPGQPLNLNLFGIFVPPTQLDVVVSARPRLTTAPASAFNPNLQTNPLPFSQFDYPLAHRVPAAPLDLSRGQPNPNIFTNPMPFLQSDITAPRSPRRTTPFEAINVALLGTPAVATTLPFNQYNFTPATKPQPQRRQDLLNPTLIASFVPPPPDAEHHSKPFFVTPGRLMNI